MDRRNWRTFLAACVTVIAATPLRADFPRKTQWVLATAKAIGAKGEQFVSSLRITNPWNVAANVTLTYLAQSPLDASFTASGDNTDAPQVIVVVAAGTTFAIEDVVETYFSAAPAPFGIEAGGIRVDSDLAVSVMSRTYVANGLSSTGVTGTYGISIPAQAEKQRIFMGDVASVSYISASPTRASGFRSNFIMLNTGGAQTALAVSLMSGNGGVLGLRTYTLAPHGSAQQTDIAKSFGYPGADTDLWLKVSVTSGGPVLLGATVIDNAISSQNYVAANKVAGFPSNGAYGTIFANDLHGMYGGRLEVYASAPTHFATSINLSKCSKSANQFYMQAIEPGYAGSNSDFSQNADGSFSLIGTDGTAAHWTGTVVADWFGNLSGTLTYTRTEGVCAGVSQTFNWLADGPLTTVSN